MSRETTTPERLRSEQPPDTARATRAGRNNLEAWNRSRCHPEIAAAVRRFDDRLGLDIGPEATAAKTALRASATTLFAGILLAQRQLLSGRRRTADLLALLPSLTGALNRVLRPLGSDVGDPDADPTLDQQTVAALTAAAALEGRKESE